MLRTRRPPTGRPPTYEPLPMTEHQLDGAEAAAKHLLGQGLLPIFDTPTLRAMWHRDRELSLKLAKIRGIV